MAQPPKKLPIRSVGVVKFQKIMEKKVRGIYKLFVNF